MNKHIYIAGPMRGFPRFNFDSFDDAARELLAAGWDPISPAEMDPISPAEMDRVNGFDPNIGFDNMTVDERKKFTVNAMARNLEAINRCGWLAVLPGWEGSVGSMIEIAYALSQDKPVYLYPDILMGANHSEQIVKIGARLVTGKPGSDDKEDILEEALRLTSGGRQAQYGPPDQDFARTAGMWSSFLGHKIQPWQVAAMMIMLKLSRETHQRKRDNWTDTAGYARCGWLCRTNGGEG